MNRIIKEQLLNQPFKFLDIEDDLGLELPVLVLSRNLQWDHNCMKQQAREYLRKFNDERSWYPISHQCGGLGCTQQYLLGTILTMKQEVKKNAIMLSQEFYDSQIMYTPSLNSANKYRASLKRHLDVNCNNSYFKLQEAIYPIDYEHVILTKLCTDNIHSDLDRFVNWKNNFEKMIGIFNRWQLYILGENSD